MKLASNLLKIVFFAAAITLLPGINCTTEVPKDTTDGVSFEEACGSDMSAECSDKCLMGRATCGLISPNRCFIEACLQDHECTVTCIGKCGYKVAWGPGEGQWTCEPINPVFQ